jgi:hypothetical protein
MKTRTISMVVAALVLSVSAAQAQGFVGGSGGSSMYIPIYPRYQCDNACAARVARVIAERKAHAARRARAEWANTRKR